MTEGDNAFWRKNKEIEQTTRDREDVGWRWGQFAGLSEVGLVSVIEREESEQRLAGARKWAKHLPGGPAAQKLDNKSKCPWDVWE